MLKGVIMKKFFLFVLVLLVYCLNAVPKWYEDPSKYYDSQEYIIGLGFGNSYEEAIAKAKQDLIQKISVNVEAVTETEFMSVETEDKTVFTDKVSNSIKAFSDYQLQGLEILNQEIIKQQHYIIIAIDKIKMLREIESELNSFWLEIEEYLNSIDLLEQKGNLSGILDSYKSIQDILPEFITKKKLFNNLAPSSFDKNKNITIGEIETKIKKLVSSIKFEVVEGNQQVGKTGLLLSEPIVFNVTFRANSDIKTNLINLPVKISYGDGILVEKGKTNYEGCYTTYITAIPDRGDRGKVIIGMDLTAFPSEYRLLIENISNEAYYKVIETLPLYAQLKITDEASKNLLKTENQLKRIFSNHNIYITDESVFLIQGIASVKESKIIEGMGSPKYLIVTSLDLEVKSTASNVVLGSLQGIGRGISEKDEIDAKEKAYENIALNSKDIKVLLGQIEQDIKSELLVSSRKYLNQAKNLIDNKQYQDAIKVLLKVSYDEDLAKEAKDLIFNLREKIAIKE
jgi:hypothetical protein